MIVEIKSRWISFFYVSRNSRNSWLDQGELILLLLVSWWIWLIVLCLLLFSCLLFRPILGILDLSLWWVTVFGVIWVVVIIWHLFVVIFRDIWVFLARLYLCCAEFWMRIVLVKLEVDCIIGILVFLLFVPWTIDSFICLPVLRLSFIPEMWLVLFCLLIVGFHTVFWRTSWRNLMKIWKGYRNCFCKWL